jgi:8-oxo-dGTP pyrophosphatase MutT (NUDIX family)
MKLTDSDYKSGLPWRTLKSRVIHETPWYLIREDQVQIHTGGEITYTYLDHPGAVAIVPVTTENEVVLINQYRYPIREWCWEVPMGGVLGVGSLETARRELMEEVGGTVEKLEFVSSFYASNGTSNINCDVFLASGVALGQDQPEDTELIKVVVKSKIEVMQMARAGKIIDGMAALALFLCEPIW